MESSSGNPITFSEIALALACDYDSIFVIDALDDSYVEYLAEGDNKELIKRASGSDFYKDVINDSKIFIHPEDQDLFVSSFTKEHVTEVLTNGKSFTLNYRYMAGGKPYHYFLKTIKGTDEKVIVGVQNIDEQRRKELAADEQLHTYRHIAGALASRYEVIYYINIKTNEYTVYSLSEEYADLGTTINGTDFFSELTADVRKIIFKDDIDYVLRELDKEILLKNLEHSGTVSLSYRQQLGEDLKYVTLNVVRPKNDRDHIVMGLMNTDAQMKHEQIILAENKLFNEVAMALATRYEVIYRVDINTNEYYEYSSSAEYTKLEMGNRGDDFFADCQENMKHDIFEEDYPMMSKAILKESILEQLKTTNKIILNYRLNLGGRPQYVSLVIMRADDNSDFIIVAVENVDESKRREMEYETKLGFAIDMANKDALTGVKNKHAYVNIESQLDEQITSGEESEFGIVICDINGLKQVNDEQGHSAGDIFIKDACNIICEVFDHSPVFRIGGDEFVVLLKGTDYDNRLDLLKEFYNRQIDNRHKGLVTLAYGMAEYYPGLDNRTQDVFERADNLMYENKNRFKNQPVNEEVQAIESYSFVRFYELYEQLLTAFVSFDTVDVSMIESLLDRIGRMFRLCKGVTRVFKNPQEERDGTGETLKSFDLGEGKEVLSVRVVTSVMSSAVMTVYMDPKEEPLSAEEYKKVELVVRTVLSFISRNRLKDIVYNLAYYDDSGYPNLRSLIGRLEAEIRQNGFKDMMAARYNLRHFSLINQEFGREVGDKVMRAHYDALLKIIGDKGFIGRLGGDNFFLMCPKDKADAVSDFLFEAVIRIDESSSVKIPSSAGVLVYYEGFKADNQGDIMGAAINAFRVAQSGSSDNVVFFNENIMRRKQKLAAIQGQFSDALANEEFRPYYQPKVDINTGKIIGGEALCRWFHKGIMITPINFIPALEQSSDICKLDLYMLEHVCRDQRKWLDGGEGRTLVPMSINFSRKNIMNLDLPDTIEKIMDKYRIPHDCIEIELTETTTDVEFSDLRRVVAGLHEKGIPTSIDDFGMGYSSLNILKGIPWTTLKIDKIFLPEDGDDESSEKCIMFKSVVSLTKALGFKCIAEGVETEYQIKKMKEYGCDLAQGYFYDKPLPKEEFEARLETKRY